MKKTLTVNLGGTVFHIDEDAYQLLERYLSNLRIHFAREEGADEIMSDFESRISEILSERVRLGYEVITIEHVETVIKRMGKVEDLFDDESTGNGAASEPTFHQSRQQAYKRFFRNPDDRVLGGVCGGFAAFMGWDPTPIRLLLFLLIFLYGVTIPIYLILWLVVPVAQTATEKLQMRGQSITVENIGKTVTEGFEKVSSNVRDYVNSDKSRNVFRKAADVFVEIIGVLLKVAAVLAGVALFPALLVMLLVAVALVVALIVGGVGGGFGLLYHLIPHAQWDYPEWILAAGGLCIILLIALPVVGVLYSLFGHIFKLKPLPRALRISLIIVWIVALLVNLYIVSRYGIPLWGWGREMNLVVDSWYMT